jgi:hypothetical protein
VEAQDVRHAERRRSQEVALQGHAIAVAYGELQHRLDAVLGQDGGGSQRRHVRAGARAIGDVDRIGQALEAAGALQHRRGRAGIGR